MFTQLTVHPKTVNARNFFVSSRRNTDTSDMTTELFIPYVIQQSICSKHGAARGEYCFTHEAMSSRRTIGGVCNKRALKCGFTGLIDQRSLRSRLSTVLNG